MQKSGRNNGILRIGPEGCHDSTRSSRPSTAGPQNPLAFMSVHQRSQQRFRSAHFISRRTRNHARVSQAELNAFNPARMSESSRRSPLGARPVTELIRKGRQKPRFCHPFQGAIADIDMTRWLRSADQPATFLNRFTVNRSKLQRSSKTPVPAYYARSRTSFRAEPNK